MMYTSRSGAWPISRSVSVGDGKKRGFETALRPRTILVTCDKRENVAICSAISSPYSVSMRAPSCWASRLWFSSRFSFSCPRHSSSSRCTYTAENRALKAAAIRAAVRMMRSLLGDEDRQTKMCSSPLGADAPWSRLTRSAQRRKAISRSARKWSSVKKLSIACIAWAGA